IAWNGRMLVVGFASGSIPSLPANLTLLKGASLVGVFWGSFAQVHLLHRLNWVHPGLDQLVVGIRTEDQAGRPVRLDLRLTRL
ncbi:NADPH:quinone oxidoreductase family protein, partial [Pseudomonas aeruginosa]|nr:NADPH:quinone oxidoreductase family protein [Pseudomonas aeruginosa]